jgi:hypothetical protein
MFASRRSATFNRSRGMSAATDLHRVTITQPTSAIRDQSFKAVGLHPAIVGPRAATALGPLRVGLSLSSDCSGITVICAMPTPPSFSKLVLQRSIAAALRSMMVSRSLFIRAATSSALAVGPPRCPNTVSRVKAQCGSDPLGDGVEPPLLPPPRWPEPRLVEPPPPELSDPPLLGALPRAGQSGAGAGAGGGPRPRM